MFVLYRYHFEQIYYIDSALCSCFLFHLMIGPPPRYPPAHKEQQTSFTGVQTGFTLWPTRLTKTRTTCVLLHHLQLFPVCLAACKYQHRKWCHPGDAVNPVWFLFRSKVAPGLHFALFDLRAPVSQWGGVSRREAWPLLLILLYPARGVMIGKERG